MSVTLHPWADKNKNSTLRQRPTHAPSQRGIFLLPVTRERYRNQRRGRVISAVLYPSLYYGSNSCESCNHNEVHTLRIPNRNAVCSRPRRGPKRHRRGVGGARVEGPRRHAGMQRTGKGSGGTGVCPLLRRRSGRSNDQARVTDRGVPSSSGVIPGRPAQ